MTMERPGNGITPILRIGSNKAATFSVLRGHITVGICYLEGRRWLYVMKNCLVAAGKLLLTVIAIVHLSLPSNAQGGIPKLVTKDGVVQLVVDGKPFLVLGGELGNSSASDMRYM